MIKYITNLTLAPPVCYILGNMKPKVIACLIVKDEEALLSRCLDSIKGVDTIYISDTGSTDKTVEISKKYTDKIWVEDIWHQSFCDARNFILNKAKEELKDKNVWVISIDADEFLNVSVSKLREEIQKAEDKGILAADIKLIAEGDGQVHLYPRLFKLSPLVWWEGVAHNHISVKAAMTTEVEVIYGYSPAHQLNPNRTLDILTKEVEKTGNARETFYLGREYWYRSNYLKCVEIMEDYVKKAHFLPEKADAYLILARCYFFMGRGDEARQACMQAITVNPHFREAIIFMSRLAGKGTGNPLWENNGRFWEEASKLADNSQVLFVRDLEKDDKK